jgi:uncharacterized protein YwqG
MEREEAVKIIRESIPADHVDLLVDNLMPSARVLVDAETETSGDAAAHSHFGGLPLFPPVVSWPLWDKRDFLNAQASRLEAKFKSNPRATGLRDIAARMRQDLSAAPVPLLFLGQFDLKEVHAAAPLAGWPRSGVLAFFHDPSSWGFDPLARGNCRVLFFEDESQLAAAAAPASPHDESKFPKCNVRFKREWTLPTDVELDGIHLSHWSDDRYRELCGRLMGGTTDREPIHRFGGHPQQIQGDMRLECQLVTNGIYCGDPSGYQNPRRAPLEKGTRDWRLLLQIDSDERLKWMWGDLGRIYFWMRQQDIKTADFDRAWAILQCY